MQYMKAKSTAKVVVGPGKHLEKVVKDTLLRVAELVGATLGPGGRPVLIERQENLPEFITKDGITVFKSIGLRDPVAHSIMSAARDAAARTSSEAGDGTTTATVLAAKIVELMHEYLRRHPKESPQAVVRALERAFQETVRPFLREKISVKCSGAYEEGLALLRKVATVSANGDAEIADVVIRAIDLVGERGHVTISELSGQPHYEVERIDGFPVNKGYEESCARFYPAFVNDRANQRCHLERPIFVLYDGSISDTGTIIPVMEMIGRRYGEDPTSPNCVVLVAHGFSEMVLQDLSVNFPRPETTYVYPLLTPQSMVQNSRSHFLHDLSAFTGARVFDLISNPLSEARMSDLGHGMEFFESFRFRSTVVGKPDETAVSLQAEVLQQQLKNADSQYDKIVLQERIGILTAGIAKIRVYGATQGELKEKRDRVEDAVCAVRGAAEHGVLPGGGKALVLAANLFTRLYENSYFIGKSWLSESKLSKDVPGPVAEILAPAMRYPVRKILENAGKSDHEVRQTLLALSDPARPQNEVCDLVTDTFGDAVEKGLLDSVPAVVEALGNALSIASLLGTLGGCVVFPRDREAEAKESSDTYDFLESANAADERP